MNIDWNPVVHILDELSEGAHSFWELSYSQRHYPGSAYLDALLFLAERKLIELVEGLYGVEVVPSEQWAHRLREAFGADVVAPHLLSGTSVQLTDGGGQLLRLLNIGHPPIQQGEQRQLTTLFRTKAAVRHTPQLRAFAEPVIIFI
jgi:hypothetical protein